MEECIITSHNDGRECIITSRTDGRECIIASHTDGRECIIASHIDGRECIITSHIDGRECIITSHTDGRGCIYINIIMIEVILMPMIPDTVISQGEEIADAAQGPGSISFVVVCAYSTTYTGNTLIPHSVVIVEAVKYILGHEKHFVVVVCGK